MKTITEFSGFSLKEAIGKKAALLTEGKTEEEAQAVINEQLKLVDDTKVAFYKNAVDMTKSRVDTVKRVVVALKSSDTESVPTAFVEREEHFYLVEYFASANSQAPSSSYGRDDRGGRGGDRGRGGRSGGGGRGDGGGRGGQGRGEGGGRGRDGGGFSNDRPYADRPRREDAAPVVRPEGSFAALKPVDPNAPKPARAPRPPRNDQPREARAPRPPRDPNAPRPVRAPRPPRDNSARGPKGAGELRLVLKGQSTTLQGSGVSAPVTEAPSAPATE